MIDVKHIERDLLCDPRNTLGVGLGGGAGSKIKFFTTWSCGIFIFDVTLLYLDEDGYKQYPSTTYQQKSY